MSSQLSSLIAWSAFESFSHFVVLTLAPDKVESITRTISALEAQGWEDTALGRHTLAQTIIHLPLFLALNNANLIFPLLGAAMIHVFCCDRTHRLSIPFLLFLFFFFLLPSTIPSLELLINLFSSPSLLSSSLALFLTFLRFSELFSSFTSPPLHLLQDNDNFDTTLFSPSRLDYHLTFVVNLLIAASHNYIHLHQFHTPL